MSTRALLKDRPELTKAFALAFHEGLTQEQACIRLGVPRSAFNEWRRLGADRVEKGKDVPGKEPFRAFAKAVTEALSTFEVALVSEISRQGHDLRDAKGNALLDVNGRAARQGDYRALQWILERRFPKRYMPQVRVHVGDQLNAAILVLERGLEPEAFARALTLLAHGDLLGDADDLGPRPAAAGGAPPAGGETTQ